MEITAGAVGKGAAVVGVGSIGGYGIYSAVSEKGSDDLSVEDGQLSTSEDNSPKYLFNIKGFGTSGEYTKSSNKFGYAFGRFMLDTNHNEEIWKQNGEKLKINDGNYLNSKFKEIKSESDVIGKLKKLCVEMYKKTRSEIVNADLSNYLKNNVWTYCTNFELRPLTIKELNSEVQEYDGKWAVESSNEEALISVSDFNNYQDTWNHIYTNILKKNISNGNKEQLINKKFKDLTSSSDLYKVCKAAYESNSIDADVDNYGRSVKEYCVLDISVNISKFPTQS